MEEKKKSIPIILFMIMCIFALIGCALIKYSRKINHEISINYSEKSNIDYKVYLKENSFFETPYLEKNRTYIASLIDYIWINFDYIFDVDKNVSGSYSYYIKGTISANKSNSEEYYWSKDYLLTEKVIKKYDNLDQIKISDEIKINYQLYNNLLTDFKSKYGITMDGFLKVYLVIENNIESDLTTRKIEKNSNIELNIPLTTLTVEVPIETSDLNNSGVLISEIVEQRVVFYTTIKYIGYVSIGIAVIIYLFFMYVIILKAKYGDKYKKILKKILKTYDNIIVNANIIPNLESLNVVSVTSFEELIDAHSEVRKPINYISSKDHAIFILISDGMAWRFDLYNEKEKNKKSKK
jgi:hypothetical protein